MRASVPGEPRVSKGRPAYPLSPFHRLALLQFHLCGWKGFFLFCPSSVYSFLGATPRAGFRTLILCLDEDLLYRICTGRVAVDGSKYSRGSSWFMALLFVGFTHATQT